MILYIPVNFLLISGKTNPNVGAIHESPAKTRQAASLPGFVVGRGYDPTALLPAIDFREAIKYNPIRPT